MNFPVLILGAATVGILLVVVHFTILHMERGLTTVHNKRFCTMRKVLFVQVWPEESMAVALTWHVAASKGRE